MSWKDEKEGGGGGGEGESLYGEEFIALPQSKKLKSFKQSSAKEEFPVSFDQSQEGKSSLTEEPITWEETSKAESDWSEEEMVTWKEPIKEESDWTTAQEGEVPWAVADAGTSEDFWGDAGSSKYSDSTKSQPIPSGSGHGQRTSEESSPEMETEGQSDFTGASTSHISTQSDPESQSVGKVDTELTSFKNTEESQKQSSQSGTSLQTGQVLQSGDQVVESNVTNIPSTSEKDDVIDPRCLFEESQGTIKLTRRP